MEKEYYYCSESVIKHFPNCKKSKPFKSGYEYDKETNYYVAFLDYEEMQEVYQSLTDDEQDYYWVRELVCGTMDVSKIKIQNCKKNGLLVEIENKLGLTAERNVAMTIKNLSNYHNCTPIEFIDKIVNK